ncbi:tetratricopeptide repeat-containing sulfotransferase family protein [Stieleria varia]|uniref:Tetratricopeptide repeat protein n=1 Tax=Stieleria varia TaxID=2528005 RepID=A0A5C6AS63_9BACT|nr:tetratricopeptide repeat-containing sulfotransferase family protein [Stieleria varia]TWU02257.1 Tetratricopeptide repeat protein [Stieleria varia]
MISNQSPSETLLVQLCDRGRKSAVQSRESIIRDARQQLQRSPISVNDVHVVAAAALTRRRPDRTLDLLDRYATFLLADPTARRIEGYAFLESGNLSKATECFKLALELDPCLPDCWFLLGQISEQSGEIQGAMQYYQRGTVIGDYQHQSALALANLQSKSVSLIDAIHTLRVSLLRDQRSVPLNKALAGLLRRHARVLSRKRRPLEQRRVCEESLQCYRVVNAAAPTSRTVLAQGQLEQHLEMFSQSLKSLQKAVELDPTCPLALTHLASANVDDGNIGLALEQFQAAMAIDPTMAITHFRYTRAKRFQPGKDTDHYLADLKELVSRPQLAGPKKLHLHFAIAKILEDIGEFEQAWFHYDQANHFNPGHSQTKIRRRRISKQAASPLQQTADSAIAYFSQERIQAYHRNANLSDKPVFIIGMPRSGTTLTEQILTSHDQIAGAGELKDIEQIRCQIQKQHGRLMRLNPETDELSPQHLYPNILSSVPAAEIRRFADIYLERLDSFGAEQLRVTDKMPTNFMQLGLIAMMFPNATIIHCRRHPMDVLVSSYCQNLSAPFCDLEQWMCYHRQYRRMIRHWESVLPMPIHTVDYEDLVSDPETHSRALIRHCGLEWQESCLQFHNNDRSVHTPSKWQVRQPMYRSSVEKWRRFEPQLRTIHQRMESELAAEGWLES